MWFVLADALRLHLVPFSRRGSLPSNVVGLRGRLQRPDLGRFPGCGWVGAGSFLRRFWCFLVAIHVHVPLPADMLVPQ